MRRTMRWAFHGLAAGSLLLCLASGILWARSYWKLLYVPRHRWDAAEGRPRSTLVEATISRGGLCLMSSRVEDLPDDPRYPALLERDIAAMAKHLSASPPADPVLLYDVCFPSGPGRPSRANRLGFHRGAARLTCFLATSLESRYTVTTAGIIVPMWSVTGLLAAPPAAWGLRALRRRRRRPRPGRCAGCGYDLRATPDGQGPLLPRCPECGRGAGLPT